MAASTISEGPAMSGRLFQSVPCPRLETAGIGSSKKPSSPIKGTMDGWMDVVWSFLFSRLKQSDLSAWEEKVSSPDPKLFNLEKQITQKKTPAQWDKISQNRKQQLITHVESQHFNSAELSPLSAWAWALRLKSLSNSDWNVAEENKHLMIMERR